MYACIHHLLRLNIFRLTCWLVLYFIALSFRKRYLRLIPVYPVTLVNYHQRIVAISVQKNPLIIRIINSLSLSLFLQDTPCVQWELWLILWKCSLATTPHTSGSDIFHTMIINSYIHRPITGRQTIHKCVCGVCDNEAIGSHRSRQNDNRQFVLLDEWLVFVVYRFFLLLFFTCLLNFAASWLLPFFVAPNRTVN